VGEEEATINAPKWATAGYKGSLKSKIEKYTRHVISLSPDPIVLVPVGPVTAPSGEESSRSDLVITPAFARLVRSFLLLLSSRLVRSLLLLLFPRLVRSILVVKRVVAMKTIIIKKKMMMMRKTVAKRKTIVKRTVVKRIVVKRIVVKRIVVVKMKETFDGN